MTLQTYNFEGRESDGVEFSDIVQAHTLEDAKAFFLAHRDGNLEFNDCTCI